MTRFTAGLFFIVIFLASSLTMAKEPDESGIGGTGISNPSLDDGIFNRPETPEFVDSPETPDIPIPEIDDARDIEAGTAADGIINTPDNPSD